MNRRAMLALSGFLLVTASVVVLSSIARAGDVSMTGTWEFNAAKSTSTMPLPKSQTRTYAVTAKEETMSGTGINASGKPMETGFTAGLDGKDYPYKGPNADMISLTPVDAFSTKFVLKNGGKPVLSGTRTMSADGKVLTLSGTGTDAAGKPTQSTLVFDRR